MSTAAIPSATSIAPSTAPIERHPVDPRDDGSLVDDLTEGRAFVFGLVVGGLVMTLAMFGLGLLAGLDAGVAAGVAPVPGVVAGLFFGMTGYLGVHLLREERHAGH